MNLNLSKINPTLVCTAHIASEIIRDTAWLSYIMDHTIVTISNGSIIFIKLTIDSKLELFSASLFNELRSLLIYFPHFKIFFLFTF